MLTAPMLGHPVGNMVLGHKHSFKAIIAPREATSAFNICPKMLLQIVVPNRAALMIF